MNIEVQSFMKRFVDLLLISSPSIEGIRLLLVLRMMGLLAFLAVGAPHFAPASPCNKVHSDQLYRRASQNLSASLEQGISALLGSGTFFRKKDSEQNLIFVASNGRMLVIDPSSQIYLGDIHRPLVNGKIGMMHFTFLGEKAPLKDRKSVV